MALAVAVARPGARGGRGVAVDVTVPGLWRGPWGLLWLDVEVLVAVGAAAGYTDQSEAGWR